MQHIDPSQFHQSGLFDQPLPNARTIAQVLADNPPMGSIPVSRLIAKVPPVSSTGRSDGKVYSYRARVDVVEPKPEVRATGNQAPLERPSFEGFSEGRLKARRALQEWAGNAAGTSVPIIQNPIDLQPKLPS